MNPSNALELSKNNATPFAASSEEERLHQVIEAAPNAMVMVDSGGVIVLVNSEAERLFGFQRDELIGCTVEVLIPVRLRGNHLSYRADFFARPATRRMGAGRDLYGLRKDGTEVPIEIGLNPLQMPEGTYVLASIIDITERKRGEERLRLVVEAAPNAMVMINGGGTIVLVNSQAEKLFGYSRPEMLGQTVELLIPDRFRMRHKDDRSNLMDHLNARPMGAGRDLYGRRKDGSEVPIEIGLNPLRTEEGQFVLASVIDITERLNADKMISASEAHALRQAILDCLPFSVIATDTAGMILAINPAAEQLLHYSRQELIGQSALLLHDRNELELRAAELTHQWGMPVLPDFQVVAASGSQDKIGEREWTYVCKDGKRVPVNVAITPLRNDSGKITGFLKVAYDITERKRSEAYIQHMLNHDVLTGLPNRMLLLDRIKMATFQALREKTQFAVLMIDLDEFKRINDTLGHQVGDQLLVTIADRLRGCTRKVNTVARLGGDEFVVLLTAMSSRELVSKPVGQITQAISEPMLIGSNELVITPSIGACMFPQDGEDPETLIKNADVAMYHAKAAGRNNFQWFAPSMLKRTEERLAISTALRHAIEDGKLVIHYQPEVSLKDRRVVGMEALVRWNDSQLGSISPSLFIPVAEETGLIASLGEWVLRTACFECVEISRRLGRELKLAVNVSPRQFRQRGWVEIVGCSLKDSGLKPNCLDLEITESVLMLHPKEGGETLDAIRKLGVNIVVDDFGIGYSSLSYLTHFPINKIKIDRSFVFDLAKNATADVITNAIIALARSLKVEVVAEGVETEQQHSYLRDQGCILAQGFLYSQAVPADEFERQVGKIEA